MSQKFGPYEILEELKSGGMGSVLLARRRGPGAFEQLVAIKTILPEYASSPAVRAMFLDEAAILARLGHPGVATVHDFGEEGGMLYMTMEYVAGIPFRDLVDLKPPPGVVARAIAEACRGLHAAHELRDNSGNVLGVVHRDISPDNLMLGFDGHVKVIDFGIALVKNRAAPVTEIGTVKGKPPYMSPEQVKNETVDRRSDVFSLGVVAWEMLTGRNLFDGDSIYAIARAVEQRVIAPPSQVAGALPVGLDGAVLNALERSVASRTPTAAAFAEQLERVIGAAGSETLEAWAERALEEPRLAHRAWLARAVAGEQPTLPRTGRATGAVTALAGVPSEPRAGRGSLDAGDLPRGNRGGEGRRGSVAAKPTLAWTAPAGPAAAPGRRRRLLGLGLVVALLLLLVGAGTVVVATRHGETPAAADAAVATAHDGSVIAQLPLDAPRPDAAPVDGAEPGPADAGRPVTVRADAAVRSQRLDAAVRIDAPAATVEPALAGTGTLNLTAQPFANVVLDGASIGPTPQFGLAVPAGKHVVKFQDPQTGATLATRTVTVRDGEKVSLSP